MDLHSRSSAIESDEDDDSTTAADSGLKANGSCLDASHGLGTVVGVNVDTHRAGTDPSGNASPKSPPSIVKSPAEGSSPPPSTKGFGLRKWRRIRRDVVKDAGANSDSSKALKRGPPTSQGVARPTDSRAADPRHNSEDSVGSVNMPINPGALLTDSGSNLDSRFVAAGVDSENSDDRSSKSSTAASAPRSRYDLPTVSGHVKEKNKIKNTSGKNVSASALRVPLGKGRLEGSKKARGERIKIETENSHSSMESDSRSSNFVFLQGSYSVTSNGKQSRVSMNYGGENGDDACAEEHRFSEEVQTNYNQGIEGENEDHLRDDLVPDASWDKTGENGGSGLPTADFDPLIESIRNLQSLHEVLETEVHKFGELGRGSIGWRDFNPEVNEPSSSDQFEYETRSSLLELQVTSLTQKVKELEIRLEDANNKLKAKESAINAIEVTADADQALMRGSGNPVDLKQDDLGQLESEVEDLYRQKIEVEVECMALAKSMQKLKVAASNPITLLDEQKALAVEQVEVLDKLGEAEGRAASLKERAEELGRYCGDILETEEALKMESSVCKVTACFFMQLILLVWVAWLLLMQLYPQFGVVVPT